jgi:hypothetical protein
LPCRARLVERLGRKSEAESTKKTEKENGARGKVEKEEDELFIIVIENETYDALSFHEAGIKQNTFQDSEIEFFREKRNKLRVHFSQFRSGSGRRFLILTHSLI